MKMEMDADAVLMRGHGVTVSIAEHQGKTEVVVQGAKHSIRVLNDNDGLHVGKRKPNRKPSDD